MQHQHYVTKLGEIGSGVQETLENRGQLGSTWSIKAEVFNGCANTLVSLPTKTFHEMR